MTTPPSRTPTPHCALAARQPQAYRWVPSTAQILVLSWIACWLIIVLGVAAWLTLASLCWV